MRVVEALAALGGIAKRDELVALKVWPASIQQCVNYGKIRKVRRGWYALHDVPESVIRARRVGGRLACVSAIAYHQGEPDLPVLHILVNSHASRLRIPHGEQVVVHWTRRHLDGTSAAVTLQLALRQAEDCYSTP